MVATVEIDALKALIAGNVRRLRQQSGLSQTELSAKAGLTPSAMWKVERGRFTVTLRTLGRLATALGVSPAMILQDSRHDDAVFVRGDRLQSLPARDRRGTHYAHLGSFRRTDLECDANFIFLPEQRKASPISESHGVQFVFVLDGYLAYLHSGRHHFARPGDSFLFDVGSAHGPACVAEGGATILSISVRKPLRGDVEIGKRRRPHPNEMLVSRG